MRLAAGIMGQGLADAWKYGTGGWCVESGVVGLRSAWGRCVWGDRGRSQNGANPYGVLKLNLILDRLYKARLGVEPHNGS